MAFTIPGDRPPPKQLLQGHRQLRRGDPYQVSQPGSVVATVTLDEEAWCRRLCRAALVDENDAA